MRGKNNVLHIFQVEIYLTRCIGRDELVVNLLGFGGQLGGFGYLEVLTSQVEGNVLLTELRDQERSEEAQSIWETEEESVNAWFSTKIIKED